MISKINFFRRFLSLFFVFVIVSSSYSVSQVPEPIDYFKVEIQGIKSGENFAVSGTFTCHYMSTSQTEGFNIYYAEGKTENPVDLKLLAHIEIKDAQKIGKDQYSYQFSGLTGKQKTWTFTATKFNSEGESNYSGYYSTDFKYNEPPFLAKFTSVPETKVTLGEEYTYKPEIETNIDNPTFNFILKSAPLGTKYDPQTGEISWIPENASEIMFNIMLQVILDDKVVAVIQQGWSVSFKKCDEICTIKGIVQDESVDTVEAVVVWLYNYENGINPTTQSPIYVSYVYGSSFELTRLDQGKYYILVDAFPKDRTKKYHSNWYNNAERMEEAVPIEINCGEVIDLTFIMKKTTPPALYLVTGKIVDEVTLKPVKPSSVGFYGKSENTEEIKSFSFFVNDEGIFKGELPDSYVYTAVASAPIQSNLNFKSAYYSKYYDNADKPENAKPIILTGDLEGIDFYLKPVPEYKNKIYGTVVDLKGSLQNGVGVTAILINSDSTGEELKYVGRDVIVNDVGAYQIENLEPGEYIIYARPQKYLLPPVYYVENDSSALSWQNATRVKVEATGSFGSFKIILIPIDYIFGKGKIKGIVRNEKGGIIKTGGEIQSLEGAVLGANVYLKDSKNNLTKNISTDKYGKFELSNIAAGTYSLVIDKIGYKCSITEITLNDESVIEQDIQLIPEEPNAVNDFSNNPFSLLLFPNPAIEAINVNFDNNGSESVVSLLNYSGIEILRKTYSSGSIMLQTNEIPAGAYFIKVQNGNSISLKSVVIVK